jgi:hypothetical protein
VVAQGGYAQAEFLDKPAFAVDLERLTLLTEWTAVQRHLSRF